LLESQTIVKHYIAGKPNNCQALYCWKAKQLSSSFLQESQPIVKQFFLQESQH